jgi:hypothetical protein
MSQNVIMFVLAVGVASFACCRGRGFVVSGR